MLSNQEGFTMTIRTKTTWTLTAYEAVQAECKAQIDILTAEGKTDGVPYREFVGDDVIIYRNWYDSVPNAEAWEAWIYALATPPSAVLIENVVAGEPAPE
jgi:phage host-nuclease inhibitor protein Gam